MKGIRYELIVWVMIGRWGYPQNAGVLIDEVYSYNTMPLQDVFVI